MDFRILGPLEVLDAERPVPLGGSRQRALLALLVLHANETVMGERLIDELWADGTPATAAKALQVQVSRLRKALAGDGPGPIVTRDRGYRLEVDPDRIDARRFERLVAEARDALAAGDPARAEATLRGARGLWRGTPLADLAYEPFAQREIARLTDLGVVAQELLVEARIALGAHAEVVGELEALIAEHPYRERLRAHLMLALYRADRQAEALQAYQDARRTLVEELGIEPGERLRELERAILAQDPALALPVAAPEQPSPAPEPSPAPSPTRATRRLVTVLVAGLQPRARLDPEALHGLLDRAAETCGAAIERHGGTVEGFAGDAVVGVFGLARMREDDARRAVRAAHELRDALAADLEVRVGIESGEVFVGGGSARRGAFAAGDARAAATALLGDGAAGEVRLGDRARALLGDAAAPATPFVGRSRELATLRAAFAEAREERSCRAVTLLGPAGIGKTRLLGELLGGLGATVAVGRCASYGEDMTFRPLAEIVEDLSGGDPHRCVAELLADDAAARAVLGAIGLGDGPVGTDDAFWAIRRLLERVAEDGPLVVVVEDVHWAEPALLDLLEYVAAFCAHSPILLVCAARPELADVRPGWTAAAAGRTVLALDPLGADDARALVEAAQAGLGEGAARRIVERAEGNPLFLEQLVAVGADGPLPSTVQAVLAARIDGLAPAERDVLEEASVQGVSFVVDAGRDTAALLSLARQGLVRPARSELPGSDVFRFAHALIRDAAYHGLPKQRRAELHEQAAMRLHAQDELAGHHLAEAYRNLAELGRVGDRERAMAATAAGRLGTAADAALRRGDPPTGARLLERAVGLVPEGDPARASLLPRLGAALLGAGRLGEADSVLSDAIDGAGRDAWLRARATVERGLVRMQGGAGAPEQDASAIAADALAVLEARGDDVGRCRALCLRALQRWIEGRTAAADGDWRRAAELARAAGDEAALLEILGWRASAAVFGPTPVPAAIRRCREIAEEVAAGPVAVARTYHPLAVLHAMAGEPDVALELVRAGDEVLAEAGGLHAATPQEAALAELLAGREAEAEVRLRRGLRGLEEMGERALLAGTAAMLARVLLDRGEPGEAAGLVAVAEATAAGDDLVVQVERRGLRARLLAEDGQAREALVLAQEGVALAARTDFLTFHAAALTDLAEVARRAGEPGVVKTATREAIAQYRRKGDVVSLRRLELIPTAEV